MLVYSHAFYQSLKLDVSGRYPLSCWFGVRVKTNICIDVAKILTQCGKWSWETQKITHTHTGRTQGIASLELVYINCLATTFCEPACVCVWLLNFLLLWLKYTQRCQLCEINTSTHSVVWPIWLRQSRLDALQGLGGRPGPWTNTPLNPQQKERKSKKKKTKTLAVCLSVSVCESEPEKVCI